MAGRYTFEVKFRLNGGNPMSSTVKADDSAEAERTVRRKYSSRTVSIIDVRKR